MRNTQLSEKEISEVLSLRGLRAEVLACRVRSNSGKSINSKLAELLVRS